MRDFAEKRQRAVRRGLSCDVSGCEKPRQKVGRFCEYHDNVVQRTGDPCGQTVRQAAVRPYSNAALAYIKRHARHPSIAEALRWAEDLLASGVPYRGRLPASATADRRLSAWLAKLRQDGVTAAEVLAVVVGMVALQEDQPRTFKSDRHFRHQIANRVLRLAGAPYTQAYANGKPRRYYARVTVGTRDLLAARVMTTIGGWALRLARHLLPRLYPEHSTSTPDRQRLSAPLPEGS